MDDKTGDTKMNKSQPTGQNEEEEEGGNWPPPEFYTWYKVFGDKNVNVTIPQNQPKPTKSYGRGIRRED